MSLTRISNRYARALMRMPQNDAHYKYLLEIASLFADEKIRKIMLSPVVPAGLKQDVLGFVCDKLDADQHFRSFIKQIIRQGRSHIFTQLHESYRQIWDQERGLLRAELFSAAPLQASVTEKIRESLAQRFSKKIEIKSTIDQSLLGGLLIKIGTIRIDFSLRRKIEALVNDAQNPEGN